MKKYLVIASVVAAVLPLTSFAQSNLSLAPVPPKIEFLGTPTLKLSYSSGKESVLTGKASVKITAGSDPIRLHSMSVPYMLHFKGPMGVVQTQSMKYSATSRLGSGTVIAPFTSVTFSITNTAKTSELFAGLYTMVPGDFSYENGYVDYQDFARVASSKSVTIVGETSPYINKVTCDETPRINCTIEGVRFSASSNRVSLNGVTKTLPSLNKNTTINFIAADFGITNTGGYMLQLSTTAGASNRYYVDISSPTISSVPKVEFMDTPVLKLEYDAEGKESVLVGMGTVKITAGNVPINFNAGPYSFVAQLLQFTNEKGQVSANSLSWSAENAENLTTIPANTSVTFKVFNKIKPSELFAGTYRFNSSQYGFSYDDSTGYKLVPAGDFVNAVSSNAITIIGERSPYISNVVVDGNGNITVSGARLNLPENMLQINGSGNSMVSKFSPTASSFTFNPAVYELSAGTHFLEITNASTGNSNRFAFITTGTPSQNVTLATPVLASVSPLSQFVVGGSQFGLATFNIKTVGGAAHVREMRFTNVGKDAIESITVAGVTAAVIDGGVTVISRLSIPISPTGTDIPVTVRFAGFQNSASGGALTQGVSDVVITLTHVEATAPSGFVIDTTPFTTSSNPMTLVGSKPTVAMSTGGVDPLILNAETKIGEFTVTADANGKIQLARAALTVVAGGVSNFSLSNLRVAEGSVTIPGSSVVLDGSTGVSIALPLYEIMPAQSKTFSVYATVSGTQTSSAVTPYLISRFTTPSKFLWRDVIGGGVTYTGAKLYNFPSNGYRTADAVVPPTPPTPEPEVPTPPIPNPNPYYNFVSGTQESCNTLVTSRYGALVSQCSVGGGCSVDGYPPSSSKPSANPTFWGACISPSVVPTSPTPPTSPSVPTALPVISLKAKGDKDTNWSTVRNLSSVRVRGSQVEFEWQAKNVDPVSRPTTDECRVNGEPLPASGKQTYSNLSAGTYHLTCKNELGAQTISFRLSLVLGASTACTDIRYNLHRGNESPNVTRLQEFLQSEGLLSEVTGFYGDKTVAAVKAYQNSKGLPMTGMVYSFTREAIAADSCQ